MASSEQPRPHPPRSPRSGDGGPLRVPASPSQQDLLLDALVRPGAGLHVEQMAVRWRGPLDVPRFVAAWQALYDGDAVLRTGLAAPTGEPPALAVHPRVVPRIAHHGADSGADWHSLVRGERLREFDLRRAGQLRVALLEDPGPAGAAGRARVTRLLFTYHHAFLDGRSMRALLRSFLRAYVADGRPRGGARRPDVRDHARWLSRQDAVAAREFWMRTAATPPDAVTLPALPLAPPPGAAAGQGHEWFRERLTPLEAARLRTWAAVQGAAESTALQAVWSLLLYRAARSASPRTVDPVPVVFSVAVSGRGIALPGVELLSGPLRAVHPLHVRVAAGMPVARLLDTLGARALEGAAYEWVSGGQIESWAAAPAAGPASPRPGDPPAPGGTAAVPRPESLVVFEPPPTVGLVPGPGGGLYGISAAASAASAAGLAGELAAEGVRVDEPEILLAPTALPLTLVARHDAEGGLVLTCVHDRARFPDADAAGLLAQAARLLRTLSDGRGALDVSGALDVLGGLPVPRATPQPPLPARVLRRAAGPGAGTICVLPAAGSPPGCYDRLPELFDGPQALAVLPPGSDPDRCLEVLRPGLARHEPVFLGGFSGAGDGARRAAARVAAHGWYPPPVAIGGSPEGGAEPLRVLARVLEDTVAAAGTSAV
ncbi:condensation domain-containing protein [Streptomyces sp. NPDC004111]|uniref:condensation domain-containing protein n=1 Tax=Streptomyces sp. NPDC004111 TaxID=3364690 RepID=UPI0036ADB1A3